MKRTIWATIILFVSASWIGAQDGPAVKPAKTITHLGCRGLSDEDKRKLLLEIIAQVKLEFANMPVKPGPAGPTGPTGATGATGAAGSPGAPGTPGLPGKNATPEMVREVVESMKDELKGDPGPAGKNADGGAFTLSFVGADGVERKAIPFVQKEPGKFVAVVPPIDAVGIDINGKEEKTWFTVGVPIIIKNRRFTPEEIKAIAQEIQKAK